MGAISAGLSMLIAKLAAAVEWIGNLFKAVFGAMWDIGRDLVCWVFESFVDVAIGALGSVDFSALGSWAGYWSGLPDGVVEVLGAVGVTTAVGIIATAIGVRMLLQLIPFVRLGS